MRPQVHATLLLASSLVIAGPASSAQEPAAVSGHVTLRYPQGGGFYHYLNPCTVTPASSTQPADPAATPVATPPAPAICWAIVTVRVKKVDGKLESSTPASGILAISAKEIQFAPSGANGNDLAFRSPVSSMIFQHGAGKLYGVLAAQSFAYQFVFNKVCDGCTPNAGPSESSPSASLDAEFDLVGQSLKQFDEVSKRVVALALSITPPLGTAPPGLAGMAGVAGSVPSPAGPVPISPSDAGRNLIERHDPLYPVIAKDAHVQGTVLLHVVISKTGTVESLEPISGPQLLKASAIDAVKQWKFKPYLLNGEPIEVETTITVNFSFGSAPDTVLSRHP